MNVLSFLPTGVQIALTTLRDKQEGQALVEYALILFLVALVSIAILGTLGGTVTSMLIQVTQDF